MKNIGHDCGNTTLTSYIAVQLRANNEPMDNEDDDGHTLTGHTVEVKVTLAKTTCKYSKSLLVSNTHSIWQAAMFMQMILQSTLIKPI